MLNKMKFYISNNTKEMTSSESVNIYTFNNEILYILYMAMGHKI